MISPNSRRYSLWLQLTEEINKQSLHLFAAHLHGLASSILAPRVGVSPVPSFRPATGQRTVTSPAANEVSQREISVVTLVGCYGSIPPVKQSLYSVKGNTVLPLELSGQIISHYRIVEKLGWWRDGCSLQS
jgi:hypothetical protein